MRAMKYDLGFLGGGQLARMSIHAAQRLGLNCLSLDPGTDTPASQVADAIVGSLSDPNSIRKVFTQCARVTLENEFIPAAAIREALAGEDESRLMPGIETLATIQDKLLQRRAYEKFGVPSPPAVDLVDLMRNRSLLPLPLVLKARFGGYDGRGTRFARDEAEFLANAADLGDGSGWLAEAYVPFYRELAVMAFVGNETGCFPTMETIQTKHVCDLVFPSGVDASEVALAAVAAVGGRGLFGVELFETDSGEFLINEIAPRPHNTGHYTLDWGCTSQFEQHVRLASGLPVDSRPRGLPVCMANILGVDGELDLRAATDAALALPGVHLHWYGKREMRAGRKMGHLNAVGPHETIVDLARLARSEFFRAGVHTA
jgi:5-(carboxyamino)imidazole ribonucleotide synthase